MYENTQHAPSTSEVLLNMHSCLYLSSWTCEMPFQFKMHFWPSSVKILINLPISWRMLPVETCVALRQTEYISHQWAAAAKAHSQKLKHHYCKFHAKLSLILLQTCGWYITIIWHFQRCVSLLAHLKSPSRPNCVLLRGMFSQLSEDELPITQVQTWCNPVIKNVGLSDHMFAPHLQNQIPPQINYKTLPEGALFQ